MSDTSKRAIGYCRISTADQSNYSIPGQQQAIQQYCARMGWELTDIRTDEGQSAKNFDRVQWRQLEAYIRLHYKQIDYLVVMKYDRFSRNVSEALAMLKKLEDKYKIIVVSTSETVGLHPQSPYFFQFRTQMLMNAELELRVIKDRTKFGIVTAAKSGKYIGSPPYGLKKLKNGDTTLVIDETKADAVRNAYTNFLNGMTMAQVHRQLRAEGCNIRGNSAMQRMLSNCIYTGLVHVPAYYDEPEQIVESPNPKLIDRITWWKVQAKLKGRDKVRVVQNDEVPLRGVLYHYSGQLMTAGKSKGKTKYYWYYKCNGYPENYRADKLHAQFDELVAELDLPEEYIEYLQQQMVRNIESRLQRNMLMIRERQQEIKNYDTQLDSLTEKFIANDIDADTFRKFKARILNDKYLAEEHVRELNQPVSNVWKTYAENMHHLMNISTLYSGADLQMKQSLIKLVFNNKLYYQDGVYRTLYISPLFALKAASLKEKGLLIIEQPLDKVGISPVGSEDGS